MKNKYFVLGILLVFSLMMISAEVGLGISPSKMREQVVAGESYVYNFLIFNTGDQNISVDLIVEGEISEFVTIEKSEAVISPEPKPHEFPIKEGVNFKVTFNIPKSMGEKTYTGTVSAIGGSSSESQFGGSVGVSSQIEFISLPPESFFSRLELKHYLSFLGVVLIILVIYLLRKSGFHVEFSQKKKKPSRKK